MNRLLRIDRIQSRDFLSDIALGTAVLVIALVLMACGGDLTGSVGELGRLRYTLFTDYEVPEGQLTDARIVSGHQQSINVTFTDEGRQDADDPTGISHTASPSAGASIDTVGGSGEMPPSFNIEVSSAGQYMVESMLDGEVFDRIKLTFDEPADFEMILKIRAPYAESFTTVTDPKSTIACVEGSQITVDAAPLDVSGDRLAGKVSSRVTVDPKWAAVPGVGIVESYEDGVWKANGQANLYFVEPGMATVTITDPVSGAIESATFDVSPIPKS